MLGTLGTWLEVPRAASPPARLLLSKRPMQRRWPLRHHPLLPAWPVGIKDVIALYPTVPRLGWTLDGRWLGRTRDARTRLLSWVHLPPWSHHELTVQRTSTSLQQQKERRCFFIFFHHSLLLHRLCSRQEHQWPAEHRLTLPPPSGSCLPPLRDQRPAATSWASLVKAARLRSIGSFGGGC